MPADRDEWEIILDAFMAGKNAQVLENGYSPAQHLFGRQVRLPAELLDEQECVISRAMTNADDGFFRAHELRCCARRAPLENKDDKAMRILNRIVT